MVDPQQEIDELRLKIQVAGDRYQRLCFELTTLRQQRQAVLDLCAQTPRRAPSKDYIRLVSAIRAAYGQEEE